MKKHILLFISLFLMFDFLFAAKPKLKVGDEVPEFSASDQKGKTWKFSDIKGKKMLVVFFYPAAMTPGCTKQACAFRDDKQVLADMGIEVIGISGDNSEGLGFFTKAHQLNFTLLADENGTIADTFGVPNKKKKQSITRKVDGKDEVLTRGTTSRRWTFLIDKQGKVAYINQKVNAAKDSESIQAIAKKLVSQK